MHFELDNLAQEHSELFYLVGWVGGVWQCRQVMDECLLLPLSPSGVQSSTM